MSRILADKVTNYNNDGPFEAEQGIDIPLSRPLQIGGFGGLSGQYLASTGAGLTWTTFPELFSGDYDDLTNKPVLFSGNFDDLNNKPAIPPFNINTPSIGEGLVYNGAFWENVALPTAYQYSIYGEQVGSNEVTVNLTDQFGATSFTTFVGTNGIEVSYNPLTDYIEIYSPNVVEYDAGTAKDDVSEMFLNGTKIGLSYTYNSITKTMDTVVNFPSVDVYSLSGDSSQANQARINLDADLSGNQGYVDIVGQDGVLINWDGASSTITLSKTSDDPYVLPPATTAVLGGVIADGTTITVDVEGRISANVDSLGYDDFSVGGEQAPSGNGELSYDNTTGQFTYTPPLFSVEDLNGVTLSSSPPTQNNVFYWNGASWSDADVNTLVSVSVNDLDDVFISNPQLNDYLIYNGSTWQNSQVDVSSKSIHEFVDILDRLNDNYGQILLWTGGVWESKEYNLDSINNVNASSPSDGDYLRYNQTTGNWETSSSSSSVSQLNDLSDVSVSLPSADDLLQWDGFSWVNTSLTIPENINDLNNVNATPIAGDILSWDGNEWIAQTPVAVSGSSAVIPIQDSPPINPSDGSMWWKSNEGALKIYYNDGTSSQWVDASNSGNVFNNVYTNVASFPGANVNEGSFAYSQENGAMYYSNSVSWTSQRIVTTNSSTTSDFATLLENTQIEYSVSAVDYTAGGTQEFNDARKIIRLSDNKGITDDIVLTVGDGLSISRTNDEITLVNENSFTYSISSQAATGSNATLRLGRSDGTNDDILFAGVDGLIVENTDENTITFRAPDITAQLYTDEDAQNAVATMFANGTHTNITFTYDDNTNSISATAEATGGVGTTYDLLGSNTTSNNAILTLRDAENNDDNIEIVGSGGTSVTWDDANSRITLGSTAPVNADWNATSGLSQILNKPTIPAEYTLPIASDSVLGGFKVGANLTIDPATGVLDAIPGSYTLPIADATTLGGIKVGSGLSIDGNGVLTATGGSTVPQIQDLSGTTSSLAADTTAELNITGYKAYSLFKITTDAEAWVRVYVDDASRDADSTRSEGEDPTPGSGVISEVRTTGAESILISPGIMGFNNDSPRTDTIYLAVTNRSGIATTITVTLTALQIGE